MQVTVLYFDGCPNWQTTDARLRQAITQLERSDIAVAHRRVFSAEEAEQLSFRGSPTILIDGRDPFADPDAPVGLSCRMYGTNTGLDGAPTVEQLVAVLDG
jgi:hypothetical protein